MRRSMNHQGSSKRATTKRNVAAVGLDLARNVFQVRAVDTDGIVVMRRKLRRTEVMRVFASMPACPFGMEACSSSDCWAREIGRPGQEARLMPRAYGRHGKPGKTYASDAEVICEAVTRQTIRIVAVKSIDQQAVLMLHKVRKLLVRQRTLLTNALRAHLAELGIVGAQGPEGLGWLKTHFRENQSELPDLAIAAIKALISQAESIKELVEAQEKRILDWLRSNDATRRLASIPGVGPITASAIATNVRDPWLFRSARQFAAWLGLTPRENSSGGKDRQTGISKQGHGDIRRPLVSGASSGPAASAATHRPQA